ncbi:MAG: hypothetical protein KBG28_27125 [Kofleriaceae bacterium]|jgi:thiopurine S-methyltransferase|nr:hypothetical protein [Kofleriaceae bacterium]MBP6839166.1 hypothetical protein [Kofleriaceae bacterium]MBP9207667.1 hypothetical protein [Kofleriaceae bacterium]
MDAEQWIERWRTGRIGFHEGRPNDLLVAHADHLTGRRRVLVPLCGKAEDLAFLAGAGHDVVGIELATEAVVAFFAEHGLTPEVTPGLGGGALTAYRAGPITLLAGDVFAVGPAEVGPVDAIYDRAALIALPPDLRRRYAAHLHGLAPGGAAGVTLLQICLEYEQARRDGPPFAVLADEVRALYPHATYRELAVRVVPGASAEVPTVERAAVLTW